MPQVQKIHQCRGIAIISLFLLFLFLPIKATCVDSWQEQSQRILRASGFQGGLIVHVGCTDGRLCAALGNGPSRIAQGLSRDGKQVDQARKWIRSQGLYGKVSVKPWTGKKLPYAENLVNLLVCETSGGQLQSEIQRVLAPGGVALIRDNDSWRKIVKPWPDEIDQWTHYLHGPGNNAVGQDMRVGPPQHFQWICNPRFSRSHDHLASMSAMVSAGGRVFYIVDVATPAFAGAQSRWRLVARDAFSGIQLWDCEIAPWEYHLRDFRSGPADIARRLVAIDDRVYVTLGYGKPVSALDAATGELIQTYKGTESTQEILYDSGILWLVLGDRLKNWGAREAVETVSKEDYRPPFERTTPPTHNKRVMAIDANKGNILWRNNEPNTRDLMPATLAVADGKVYFQTTREIVCLDGADGNCLWTIKRPLERRRLAWSSPTLVVHDGIVYSADRKAVNKEGDLLWMPSGGYHEYIRNADAYGHLIAYDADTGKELWRCPAHEGFNSAIDIMIADEVLWTGNYCEGSDPGITEGRDPKTGEVIRTRPPDSEYLPKIGHARCHRAKATDRFLILGRRGVEFVDVKTGDMIANRWIRGMCQYGVMPANGMLYLPPHSCACAYNDMLKLGFMALAPSPSPGSVNLESDFTHPNRLLRGPAYSKIEKTESQESRVDDWPTYRADMARNGSAKAPVPRNLSTKWQVKVGRNLTSPVIGEGIVFVANTDTHEVHALDAEQGKLLWSFHAGARIDSPPTVYQGRILFGSADGHVYCLRLRDGALAWRFQAAPSSRQIVVNDQLESAWPISGSVLVVDDAAYFAVGRCSYLDGGMWLCKLDVATGELLNQIDMTVEEKQRDGGIPGRGALPDVLSSDGESIFMRDVRLDLDLVREESKMAHLYSPVGFLDDNWWHRTYWQVGTAMGGGWGRWPKAGQNQPAGRLLVTDGDQVFGWGRNQYDIPGAHVGVDAAGVWGPVNKSRWTHLRLFRKSMETRIPRKPQKEDKPIKTVKKADDWSRRVPVLGLAMVLDPETLWLAGPLNPLDTIPYDPTGADKLADALATPTDGQLLAVDPNNGEIIDEFDLTHAPVFDGMAAADHRLYLVNQEGSVVCLGR
ncbi:PQQ-binding-like beta-propeller repeat protein [bacterium]|nr:PQQ-binding-like beta-propeller repeat protein [bacterium]